uniref:Ammonium transporter n=1 Tax=Hanusia phi TaxID=3032 RepID=A0A7S0I0Y4_9CRYP|mmetsp:Transcript_7738/g.17682  ORF Transcript_7738/g.17682 Transcript_7738/m.17682 type:complete len:549 (+) Transcript_7738:103-1749(+)
MARLYLFAFKYVSFAIFVASFCRGEQFAKETNIPQSDVFTARTKPIEIKASPTAMSSLRDNELILEKIKALENTISELQKNITANSNSISPFQSSGDVAWILTCSAFVFMMTIPGLAMFYGGLVRVQNVLSTVMQSFSIACLVTILWVLFGYSLAFDRGGKVFGSHEKFWLQKVKLSGFHPLFPSIPEPLFVVYSLTFAIITPALISGAFADRMRFGPMLVFIGLWHLLVYCPIAHSTWMTDGFLHTAGVLDFAGGNVVHVAAGCAGLMSSIVVGKRTGYGTEVFSHHNILISVLGASLLWVGWCGFNGGSALGERYPGQPSGVTSGLAATSVLNTNLAAATASLTWMCTEWIIRKRPSVLGIISGMFSGLVTITAGAGYVNVTGAFCMGFLAGPVCYFAAQLKHRFGYDDALDAFGIHAPGGALGGILTGFFATEEITGRGSGKNGAFYGNPKQIYLQLYGVVFSAVWSLVMSYVLLKLVDITLGLRVAIEDELSGLDMVCHGESLVPFHLDNDGNINRPSLEMSRSCSLEADVESSPSKVLANGFE